jgi:prenyltransferase beta subunit
MSIRLEMLQVARLAPKLLGESTELVARFIRSQQNDDGGFKDRAGKSDLYYTVFGLDALTALQQELPLDRVAEFAENFNPHELDFVHLCALIRCLTISRVKLQGNARGTLEECVMKFRAKDGGFSQTPNGNRGTAYGAFLAMSALQDLGERLAQPERLIESLQQLATEDGAWTNEVLPLFGKIGATNATAAVIVVLRALDAPVPDRAADWLLARAHPQGGFLAIPEAPIPDLLSTATALHSLASLGVPLDRVKESCLDFIDSLWTNAGGFHGNWTDDHLDCEYTFYGLLALGHLAAA